jgi:hypothetical protein
VIRRAAILLGVPVALAALIAFPLGLVFGEYQWLCAAVAVALVVTPGLITLVIADQLAGTSPYGRLVALVLGTFVRLAVGFGGAVLVFALSKPTFHTDPISYWAWVLGAYLTTLVVETVLLSGGQAAGSA